MLTKLHFEQSLIKVCRTALKNFSGLQIENLWASYKGGSVMDNLRNIHFNLNTNMYKYKHEYKYNRDPENGRWWAQSLYNKFVMGLLSWFNHLDFNSLNHHGTEYDEWWVEGVEAVMLLLYFFLLFIFNDI